MGAFGFQDAYPQTSDDESHEEQADFEIDSDVSDAELLELKQKHELLKLGPEKARDLADATVAAQEMTPHRWKSSQVIHSRTLFLTIYWPDPLFISARYCGIRTQGAPEIAQVLFRHYL